MHRPCRQRLWGLERLLLCSHGAQNEVNFIISSLQYVLRLVLWHPTNLKPMLGRERAAVGKSESKNLRKPKILTTRQWRPRHWHGLIRPVPWTRHSKLLRLLGAQCCLRFCLVSSKRRPLRYIDRSRPRIQEKQGSIRACQSLGSCPPRFGEGGAGTGQCCL